MKKTTLAHLKKAFLPVPVLLAGVFLSACQLPTFGAFHGATQQGRDEEKLWVGMVIAALGVGAIVWALIFFAAFRYRRKDDSSVPKQFGHHTILEIIYTTVPIIAILIIFLFTVLTENNIDNLAKNPSLKVHITAFQWGWKFHYEYYNGKNYNVTVLGDYQNPPTAPMPAGQTIQVELTSNDVVHGFYVPKFNFSRYAQPGFTNFFDLNILKPGIYPGRCTQFCGVYHTQMFFTIKCLSPSQFGNWISSASKGA